ncbi:MAG: bifunctional homocysteine S-methyltransferase/methylenetetrahydrofolate reductase [Oscillospiraceae bacterium]
MKKFSFFDGAFGTYYFDLTKDFMPCELANINSPQVVCDIHKSYIAAGAQAIKTNTFSVNRLLFPDKSQKNFIIKAAMKNAKASVEGTDTQIFCDIGYINDGEETAPEDYKEIAEKFINFGGENFLFETMAEFSPLISAIKTVKKLLPNSTVAVSFAVSQDGYSKKGLYYKTLLKQAEDCEQVDIIGLNCQCSPSHMRNLVQNITAHSKPLLVMPNSSYPSSVDGRMTFTDNSEYFAQKMQEIVAGGADIIGGCCGTTPEHIRLAIENLKVGVIKKADKVEELSAPKIKNEGCTLPFICKNKKLIAVELDPPMDVDMSFSVSAAYKLKEAGVDIITVADSPLARARADSIMTAAKIKREVGIETMPHISCRDKNQISLKGSLMGASFENINNILAVTGDPITQDIFSGHTGVFSFNSYGLISYIKQLNGQIFGSAPFSVGGALNVNSANFDKELTRAVKKVESGAEYFLTQPIYSHEAVQNFIEAAMELKVPILAGLMPLAGYKNAVFLNNEVSGISIDKQVVDSLKDKSREEILEISTNFCAEIAKQVEGYCAGYYLMTPMKRVDLILRLIEKIRR